MESIQNGMKHPAQKVEGVKANFFPGKVISSSAIFLLYMFFFFSFFAFFTFFPL